MDKNVKAIMRGHLININKKPIILKKFGDEFYKTHDWDVILGKGFVSFKKNKLVHRFKFSDMKNFFLKDSHIFVIDLHNVKKRFYFKIF